MARRAVVISGDEDAVLEVAGLWGQRGVKTKRLRVSHAFHSPRMEAMLEEFAEVADGLSYAAPRIPIVSNLTGEPVAAERLCSPGYWVEHVREPVRFMDGVRWLRAQGVGGFLELGPDGVLSAIVEDCLGESPDGAQGAGTPAPDAGGGPVVAVPLLRGERPEAQAALRSLAEIWANGAAVSWGELFKDTAAERVSIPTYAFQRRRYWLPETTADRRCRRCRPGDGWAPPAGCDGGFGRWRKVAVHRACLHRQSSLALRSYRDGEGAVGRDRVSRAGSVCR